MTGFLSADFSALMDILLRSPNPAVAIIKKTKHEFRRASKN